jgi:hypothetical protein
VAVAGCITAAGLLLAQEQISKLPVALAILSLGALAWLGRRSGAKFAALVAVYLAVVFAYTWALSQSMHIVIRGSSGRISVQIDGRIRFSQPISRGAQAPSNVWVGLYAGAPFIYVVGSNGQGNLEGSPVSRPADAIRFAAPRPGWRLLLSDRASRRGISAPQIQTVSGRWSTNPRGEIEGSVGAIGWIGRVPAAGFTLSGDLLRADGSQGIIFGIGSKRQGYILSIRLDHRDARFYTWRNGLAHACSSCHRSLLFPVSLTPMIQRALLFLLPSILLALSLAVVAVGLYLVVLPLALWVSRSVAPRVPSKLQTPVSMDRLIDGTALILGALGIVSGALIALNDNRTLPTIEDTATYIFQAKTLAAGALWADLPRALSQDHLLSTFFKLAFTVLRHGHWFGKYPTGWPLLLSVGALFDKAWMITPIVGGLSVLLIYLIGRELYGRRVGILAAILALSSPFVLSMSGSLLSQSATWLFCGLFAYGLIAWYRRNLPREAFSRALPRQDVLFLVAAGLGLGSAFAVRQLDALTLAIPFAILLVRRPLSILWVALGSAIPLSLLALYNQALVGNPLASGYGQAFPWDRLGFGPHVGGPTPYEADFTLARGLWNFAYDLEHLQAGLFGWPFFFALALVATPFLLGRARWWDWLLLASTGTVMVAYMTYWASGVTGGFPRYWYVTAPWLALLAARGFQELYRWPARVLKAPRENRAAAAAFPCALLVVLLAFDVHYYLPVNVFRYVNPGGAYVSTAQSAHVRHAVIFQVQHNQQASDFDYVFAQNSPALGGDVIWAIDRGRRDAKIMAAFPGRTYYRLNYTRLSRLWPPRHTR